MSSSSGSVKGAERNGVRGGGGGGGGGRAPGGGEEIASKTLMIQSKRFYLDVKQNSRGRFVKLAEVAANGRKNRLFMSFRICRDIKNLLEKFVECAANLNENDPKNENGLILSETILNDKRRYYLDLRENQRGTFLRITQLEMQSGIRNSVALPSEGISQLHDAIEEVLDEYGEGFIDEDVDLPESQTFRTDGKNFFFDPGHNTRGDFLKITELKPSIGVRNTIALSVNAIPQFTQVLNKLYEDFHALRAAEDNNENAAAKKSAPPNEQSAGNSSSANNATSANAKKAATDEGGGGEEKQQQKGTVKA